MQLSGIFVQYMYATRSGCLDNAIIEDFFFVTVVTRFPILFHVRFYFQLMLSRIVLLLLFYYAIASTNELYKHLFRSFYILYAYEPMDCAQLHWLLCAWTCTLYSHTAAITIAVTRQYATTQQHRAAAIWTYACTCTIHSMELNLNAKRRNKN